MIDIKRLHQVHKYYPNTLGRQGKTTYCFDMLLRSVQTGQYKSLCYITNTYKASEYSLNDFMEFLQEQGEVFTVTYRGIIYLRDVKITFMGREGQKIDFDGYVEDYF